MSKAGYAVGAIIALGALSAGTSEASAGGKHLRFHKFHNFHHFDHRPVFIFGGGCGYYRDMWYDTGRFFWKSKYYHCKGWW